MFSDVALTDLHRFRATAGALKIQVSRRVIPNNIIVFLNVSIL